MQEWKIRHGNAGVENTGVEFTGGHVFERSQPDFRPTHVVADFEEAPATAVRQVFGNDVMFLDAGSTTLRRW